MDYLPSTAAIVVETPAKLNLFLELIAKRPDGFHEIETLMTAINIYDRICFRWTWDWQLGFQN